ncbi:AraC family transcriptional regulator [Burkholderia stagnalis]|uniref:AraC family transcriptional regulator n=1 Tax=Burkholderia stagnalis TaxID=1503054 RepID=UPI0007526279|nr:helix-turn-helix domain-containing protein [Burkholderia stagnalis]KVO58383.1 AraC family transcriptional regulator [Burkholderia stagnalis]KVP10500.1 AraC family transcriptional regulator [Burkholderia stagnalis]KVW98128.1 AraC family transcriptional regulator [Burkholderia stagnalis]KWH80707.1 AraC family transcriptional regulator [Burkholderia stagnalis]
MSSASLTTLPTCPDPLARAPRATHRGQPPHARLYPAPPALQGALVASVCRDTRGFTLNDAQRLTHCPATPLVSLSWYRNLDTGLVERTAHGPRWQPFDAPVMLSGSQSAPLTSWAPTTGSGGMACFTADAARALFGVDLAAIHDRFVDAHALLGDAWRPLLDALSDADDDTAVRDALVHHLAPRWRALQLQGDGSALASLRDAGRHWVGRLAWQAREWGRTHSPRQVERRIKSWSGRSLRDWQALVRAESLFFAARERYETGMPFDWAGLAHDEGFADQAHLSRVAKRITGFAPTEFAQRFADDESFWLYRLWV